MKRNYLLLLLLYASQGYSQSPGNVAGFAVWLRGDFKKNFSETAIMIADRPADNTYPAVGLLNYNEALEFDGSNKQVFVPIAFHKLPQATVFVVYQNAGLQGGQTVWKLNESFGTTRLTTDKILDNTGHDIPFSLTTPAFPVINTYIKHWKNKTNERNETADEQGLFFGTDEKTGTSFKGKIAEYILYDRTLKLTEQRKIESLLAIKYGITLSHDYVNSSAKAIWSYKSNKEYSHRIFGIGRDDQSGLYQRQSCINDPTVFILISAGKIARSNVENTAVINDGNYLLFGDNDGDMQLENTEETSAARSLLKRRWLVEVSGISAHSISTELVLNADKLFAERYAANKYLLVIDRGGEGRFSLGKTDYITADEISANGMLTFRNLHWDQDHSGKDVFTFSLNTNAPASITSDKPGTNEQKEEQVSLYPNPSGDGRFNLDITLKDPGPVEVQIFDASNRLIRTISRQQQQHYLITDRINGSAGMYTFLIKSPYQSSIQRLVVR